MGAMAVLRCGSDEAVGGIQDDSYVEAASMALPQVM